MIALSREGAQALHKDLWQLGRAWRRSAVRRCFAQADRAFWRECVKDIVLEHVPRESFETRAEYRRLVRASQRAAKSSARAARVQFAALPRAAQLKRRVALS